jgi:hypothetical protein
MNAVPAGPKSPVRRPLSKDLQFIQRYVAGFMVSGGIQLARTLK